MSKVLNKMFDLELSEKEEKMIAALFLAKAPVSNLQLQEGLDKLANLPESWAREIALQILLMD